MYSKLYLPFLIFFTSVCLSQKPTQNIKGIVLDNASNQPIAAASISINALSIATKSDESGNFILSDVPVGNHNLIVSSVRYESFSLNEILVISAKETYLTVLLKEKTTSLDEVIVKSKVNKTVPLNATASVSAKMLSVEEARRYAGGFDDPARLVSSFAGVSSNVGNNGISVRGNNPKSLQWKLEGIEIPNPNHFADEGVFGAGVLSALSSNNLGNSDFFSSAFPAEYSNAISGVFDMSMRKGNNSKHEHTIQAGIMGLDFASEGPISKNNKSSYLFNYRYSTLSLIKPILPEGGGNGVDYQDLSFKLNFPTLNSGTFSVWGLGFIDKTGLNAKTNPADWDNALDKETSIIKLFMGTFGLSHKIFISNKSFIKSVFATTSNGNEFIIDKINNTGILIPDSTVKNQLTNFIFSSFINTKFTAKHTNKSGVVLTNMAYDLKLNKNSQSIVAENGNSFLSTAYTNSTLNFSDNFTMNIGLNAQVFSLNNKYTIEPRIGFKYQFKPTQTLSFGYGLHSRLEGLHYYFAKNAALGNIQPNKNLDFTKSHHLVFGYDFNIGENLHLKAESYYQYLYNVPVVSNSSFSFLNIATDWHFNEQLENTGNGRNYGIDISLDKYLTNGFYYTATVSIFNSQYTGGDKVWRNTRYNRNYIVNFLAGKEWTFGKSNQKTFGLNARFSYQGGDRYSPINAIASTAQQAVVFDETRAFSDQIAASFVTHLTLLYRVNRPKSTRELALKILNAGQFNEFYDFQYNFKTQSVEERREKIIIPNLSYKIEF